MISKGYSYTAYSPVTMKTGKLMFKIKDYNKQQPQLKSYITVFCDNDVQVFDKQKVIIEEIKSITTSEYKGQLQVAMSAVVTPDAEHKEFDTGSHNVVDSNDLPF